MDRESLLMGYYEALSKALGPCHWWPGETPFEIAVGAILVQNTNWKNVEKAIHNLKENDALTLQGIRKLSLEELQELIRPSGFFRIKSVRLINFLNFLNDNSAECITDLASFDTFTLREKLLSVKGIGPETADSILLYAMKKPIFVVDAYTRRIFNRHMLIHEDIEYHELQDFFMDVLKEDVQLFNEYHALLVKTAKEWCKKTDPDCDNCPLGKFLNN
ncbi:endonuclease III domain-containing protein [Maridesulfovibrio ferrireducens]|uniref:endonuclease III domain-containing protein n=1 Tax=Maridesulfovibrio ferrireducens TaxID=246191 RepID=UPI001A1E808D|nr:endonuclease III domain-containing protein [Maridesulfovibrio ferrireducens]MBI9110421.1 endonuclease III domain-containing protein [Maridesulfovibrio ferrireducens]